MNYFMGMTEALQQENKELNKKAEELAREIQKEKSESPLSISQKETPGTTMESNVSAKITRTGNRSLSSYRLQNQAKSVHVSPLNAPNLNLPAHSHYRQVSHGSSMASESLHFPAYEQILRFDESRELVLNSETEKTRDILEFENRTLKESFAELSEKHEKLLEEHSLLKEKVKALQEEEGNASEYYKQYEEDKSRLQQKVLSLQKSLGEEKAKMGKMFQAYTKNETEYKRRIDAWEKGYAKYKARYEKEKHYRVKVESESGLLNGKIKRREERIKSLENQIKEIQKNFSHYRLKWESIGSIIRTQLSASQASVNQLKQLMSNESISESLEIKEKPEPILDIWDQSHSINMEKLMESRKLKNNSSSPGIDPLQVRLKKTLRGGETTSNISLKALEEVILNGLGVFSLKSTLDRVNRAIFAKLKWQKGQWTSENSQRETNFLKNLKDKLAFLK